MCEICLPLRVADPKDRIVTADRNKGTVVGPIQGREVAMSTLRDIGACNGRLNVRLHSILIRAWDIPNVHNAVFRTGMKLLIMRRSVHEDKGKRDTYPDAKTAESIGFHAQTKTWLLR